MEGGDLDNIVGGFAGIRKGGRNPKAVPLTGSVMRRKRFSDITNVISSGNAERSDADGQENPDDAAIPVTNAKDYIAKLLKENTALLRLLGDRNKFIEVTGMELQKLKLSLQKANQQNWHLAQANSQMLAELNLRKDRLKAMQHELGCTAAVLRLKTIELEEEKKSNKQHKQLHDKTGIEVRRAKPVDNAAEPTPKPVDNAVEPSHLVNGKKTCDTNRKRTLRSRSLGPATIAHQETGKGKDEGRRRSLRRSIRLKTDLNEPTEDLFEIEDVKLAVRSHEDASSRPESFYHIAPNDLMNCQDQDCRSQRHSIGRPQRRAAEKVNSYREAPINVKMRRAD